MGITVPDGGFEEALNVVVSRDDLVQKRRGFKRLAYIQDNSHLPPTYTWAVPQVDHITYYQNYPIVMGQVVDSPDFVASLLYYLNESTGDLTAITDAYGFQDMKRTAQASGNLYFVSSNLGIGTLEAYNGSTRLAGIPGGLDLDGTNTLLTGVFPPDNQVGYRIVFGRTDGNNNKNLGAPTEFLTLTNTLNADKTATESTLTVTVTHNTHGLSTSDVIISKNAVDSTGAVVTGIAGEYSITRIDANQFSFIAVGPVTGTLAALDYGVYKTPAIDATLPDDITVDYFYQVYRSSFSGSEDVIPSEDCQLIYETQVTSTDVSNGYIGFADSVDPLFAGAYLYTNPNTGDGITSASEPPPLATDIAFFATSMFYANTETKYLLQVDLISVASATFAVDDTISITDGTTTRTYTAKSSSNYASQQFKLTNSGGAFTVAQSLALTARDIVRCINRDPSGICVAKYISGPEDVPGKIVFIAKSFKSQIKVFANDSGTASNFSPVLGVSAGTAIASTNADYPHALYYSKIDEPGAVPSLNYLFVGTKDAPILRIVPLRDSLIIIKTDGIYRLVGTQPADYAVSLLDGTITCRAPDSVASLANSVYLLSNQSFLRVTDTSATVISRQIEPLITSIFSNSTITANAVSYESDRVYMVTCNDTPVSGNDLITWVYNTVTDAWTTSDVYFNCGLVSPATDKLILSEINASNDKHTEILQERKSYEITDNCDASTSFTWVSVSGTAGVIQTRLQSVNNSCTVYNDSTNYIFAASSAGATATNDSITCAPITATFLKITDSGHGIEPGDYVVITNAAASGSPLTTWNGVYQVQIVDGDDFYIKYESARTGTPDTCSYGIRDSWDVTFKSVPFFSVGASGTIYQGIHAKVKTVPVTGGSVGLLKQFSRAQAHFRSVSASRIAVSFSSDSVRTTGTYIWDAPAEFTRSILSTGWGGSGWGMSWGGYTQINSTFRTFPSAIMNILVPLGTARCTWIAMQMDHYLAAEAFELQTITLSARAYKSRTSR